MNIRIQEKRIKTNLGSVPIGEPFYVPEQFDQIVFVIATGHLYKKPSEGHTVIVALGDGRPSGQGMHAMPGYTDSLGSDTEVVLLQQVGQVQFIHAENERAV